MHTSSLSVSVFLCVHSVAPTFILLCFSSAVFFLRMTTSRAGHLPSPWTKVRLLCLHPPARLQILTCQKFTVIITATTVNYSKRGRVTSESRMEACCLFESSIAKTVKLAI